MDSWLKSLDETNRVQIFFGMEMRASPADARKIERHPLRPATVAPLVEAARKEVEAQKQARKAEAQRAKEAREKEKLAELLAKYGPTTTDKAEKVADREEPHRRATPDLSPTKRLAQRRGALHVENSPPLGSGAARNRVQPPGAAGTDDAVRAASVNPQPYPFSISLHQLRALMLT